MEHFLKIAENIGVKKPRWSGLTKRTEDDDMNSERRKKSTTPSC